MITTRFFFRSLRADATEHKIGLWRCPMKIIKSNEIDIAVEYLKQGKVIAHPTEAVFGLACDPDNIDAVSRILQIKHRAMDKGFIMIGANWEQIEPLITYVRPDLLTQAFETWPGPVTWLFPASKQVPSW